MSSFVTPEPAAPQGEGHTGGRALARVVGLPGAVLLGLGSILGTGIFVSIGIAAGVAGPSVLLAVAAAALVATFNGLSSAQLAASHPVSGGTYEYGYRYLSPTLGFVAGWTFLCAKSASAATAALGFAGYGLHLVGRGGGTSNVVLAALAVASVTAVVASGMRRSNRVNVGIVSLTLLSLLAFVAFGFPSAVSGAPVHLQGLLPGDGKGTAAFLHATALMFVAYTGYGRIATLGEEVADPARNIPRAIILTLLASMTLYLLVTAVAVGAVGAPSVAQTTDSLAAPLELVAKRFGVQGVSALVAIGAVIAMLGVLLNLLLGLSRVLLAMARRGDVPRGLARVEGGASGPRRAIWVVGVLVLLLSLCGSVKTTWSFSAFAVLVYYAITNLAALRLPPEARLYPRAIPCAGLVCCLGLAFWVDPTIWLAGLAVIAAGLVLRGAARRWGGVSDTQAREPARRE